MNKKELLKSLHDVYCRLGPTQNGVGVIAVRTIPKGTDPFKRCDPFGSVVKITKEELAASDAPESVKQMVREYCALQNGIFFVPSYGIDAVDKSYFLNHSDKPTLVTKDKGGTFRASREIKAGEELTADYRTYNKENMNF